MKTKYIKILLDSGVCSRIDMWDCFINDLYNNKPAGMRVRPDGIYYLSALNKFLTEKYNARVIRKRTSMSLLNYKHVLRFESTEDYLIFKLQYGR
jgi:hypothetical protein